MGSYFVPAGLGWQPDVPDVRDHTVTRPSDVEFMLERMGFGKSELRSREDIRDENLLPPAQDQGNLGASCAFAVMDLVEYLERKYGSRFLEGSKLFLHQMSLRFKTPSISAENYHALDTTLRTTFKALRRVGTPPAVYWAYDAERFNSQPIDPLLFSFSREYASIQYVRLDVSPDRGAGPSTPDRTIGIVKQLLANGIPCVCGISVPRSLTTSPLIPVPNGRDELRGGQAVLILGYEDSGSAGNKSKAQMSPRRRNQGTGTFLIRSSWGTGWGDEGYGWLPQEYITMGFASDFWTAVKPDWCGEARAKK